VTSTRDKLIFERDYSSPPEHLFMAWTQVPLLQRWFGCAPDRLWSIHLWEARVGGRLHVSLDFDGRPFEVRGEFLTVDPPSRLIYRWSENEIVDVVIELRAGGSHLRVTHTFPATHEARDILTMGWSTSLTQLESTQ
jgi:uncharacterized protein YndB with AHSA1/START domain